MRELVASAVGFDESRGDIITIKSMALQSITPQGTEAQTSLLDMFQIDVMSAIQMVILAIVALVLGLFVVRPILSRPHGSIASPSIPPAIEANAQPKTSPPALTGEVSDLQDDFRAIQSSDDGKDIGTLPAMNFATDSESGTPVSSDPVERLRAMIGDRQEETVEILRSWLEDSEERA